MTSVQYGVLNVMKKSRYGTMPWESDLPAMGHNTISLAQAGLV